MLICDKNFIQIEDISKYIVETLEISEFVNRFIIENIMPNYFDKNILENKKYIFKKDIERKYCIWCFDDILNIEKSVYIKSVIKQANIYENAVSITVNNKTIKTTVDHTYIYKDNLNCDNKIECGSLDVKKDFLIPIKDGIKNVQYLSIDSISYISNHGFSYGLILEEDVLYSVNNIFSKNPY